MDKSNTPDGVRSSEGLGLAPERAAFEAWIVSHGGSVDWTGAGEYRSAPTECAWAAWQAATAAATIPKERLALNVRHRDCHKAADAFWAYWKENGETHRHGYYESTWGAINRALRTVGVVEHEYMRAAAEAMMDSLPTPQEHETFTDTEVQSAIRAFLEYGEQETGKSHLGYFSGSGWAACCLRWHLGEMRARQARLG